MKYLSIVYLIAFSLSLSAQNFYLFDKDTETPIEWASIRLYKGTILKQVVSTNESGMFTFSDSLLSLPDTKLRISVIGYESLDTLFNSKTLKYFIKKSNSSLNEFIVKAKRSHVNFENGKLIYNIRNDSLYNKSILAYAMSNLPGFDVDLLGKVSSIDGKKILYLLNGKEDPLVKEGKGLNSITARLISRVELVVNPNQEYIERGYDLVLNIISKTDLIEGTVLTINPAIDNRGVFNHNAFFSYRKNKFNVTLNSISFNHKYNSISEGNFFNEKSKVIESIAKNHQKISSSSLEVGNLISGGFINFYFNADLGMLKNKFANSFEYENLENGENKKESGNYTMGVAFKKNKVFKNTNFYIASSYSNKQEDNSSLVNREFLDNSNWSDNQTKTFNIQSTFTTSLKKSQKITYGTQHINRLFDLRATNQESKIRQDVLSLLSYYSKTLKSKWRFDIGSRVDIQSTSSLNSNINFNDGLSIIPKVIIVKNFPKNQNISVNFNATVSRPSTSLFDTFVDYSNPLLQTTGNPNLRPEKKFFSNLSYSKYGNQFYWGTEASYSFSYDEITRIIETKDGENLFKYENSDSRTTTYAAINFGGTLFKRKLNFDLRSYLGFNNIIFSNNSYNYFLYHFSFSSTYNAGRGFFVRGHLYLNSPIIFPQGRSSADQTINLSVSKALGKNLGSVVVSVNDPFLKQRKFLNIFNEFESIEKRQARLISLSVILRLGKLSEGKVLRGIRTTEEDKKER